MAKWISLVHYRGETFSNSFQKNREKQKKNDRKTAILRKTTFRQNRFFDLAVTQKRIIVNT